MAPLTPPLPPASAEAKSDEEDDVDDPANQNERVEEGSEGQKLKPLHKTVSLFLRNLPVNVAKAEIEEVSCSCFSFNVFML